MAWVYALASVGGVSLLALAGALSLVISPERFRRLAFFLVAFAAGGLAGDSFLHLLPEAFARLSRTGAAALALLGMLTLFLVEKGVRRSGDGPLGPGVHPMVTINLFGDALHNFIDGMLIGASYLVDFQLGLSTTLAVAMHELPHELGDFAVLVHGGLPVRRALGLNLLTALTAVLGTLLALAVGAQMKGLAEALVPFTAGAFLYIALTNLLPELLLKKVSLAELMVQVALMLLGSGLMALLLLWG